eukprot:m.34866 g.34866  ORF g.34866 m.34866 type:complete len:1731 (-) comp17049_c0_seq1:123-5315(-)
MKLFLNFVLLVAVINGAVVDGQPTCNGVPDDDTCLKRTVSDCDSVVIQIGCPLLCDKCELSNKPTQVPTSAPMTMTPTSAPSGAPTSSQPTLAPYKDPFRKHTLQPSAAPSRSPTRTCDGTPDHLDCLGFSDGNCRSDAFKLVCPALCESCPPPTTSMPTMQPTIPPSTPPTIAPTATPEDCVERCQFDPTTVYCKPFATYTPCTLFAAQADCPLERCFWNASWGCDTPKGLADPDAPTVCESYVNQNLCQSVGDPCVWDQRHGCTQISCDSYTVENDCTAQPKCAFDSELFVCHDKDAEIRCSLRWKQSTCEVATDTTTCLWNDNSKSCEYGDSEQPCDTFTDDNCPEDKCFYDRGAGLCLALDAMAPCHSYKSIKTCPIGNTEYQYSTDVDPKQCRPLSPQGCAEDYYAVVATLTSDRTCLEIRECVRGVEYEESPPSLTSNRVCKPISDCDLDFADHYTEASATATSDAVCLPYTVCNTATGKYQTRKETPTRDRKCKPLTPCNFPDEYAVVPETLTSDRECGPTTQCNGNQYTSVLATLYTNAECEAMTVCKSDEYERVSPSYQGEFRTSDRKCGKVTTCDYETEYEHRQLTATSDRLCFEISDCEFEYTAPTRTSDRDCCDPDILPDNFEELSGSGSGDVYRDCIIATATSTTTLTSTTSTSTTLTSTTSTITATDDRCEATLCADDCDGECGWNLRKGLCITGGKTTEDEAGLGVCDPCKKIICGANCTGKCGWNTRQGVCLTGGFTSDQEKLLGVCFTSPPTMAPTTAPTANPTPAPTTLSCFATASPFGPFQRTFDGHEFTLEGACTHTLIKECEPFSDELDGDEESGDGSCSSFAVAQCPAIGCIIRNNTCATEQITQPTHRFEVGFHTEPYLLNTPYIEDGVENTVQIKVVMIRLPGGDLLELEPALSTDIRPRMRLNNRPFVVDLPYSNATQGLSLTSLPNPLNSVSVIAEIHTMGVSVRWNAISTVQVWLNNTSPLLAAGLCSGLCGDADGIASNDAAFVQQQQYWKPVNFSLNADEEDDGSCDGAGDITHVGGALSLSNGMCRWQNKDDPVAMEYLPWYNTAVSHCAVFSQLSSNAFYEKCAEYVNASVFNNLCIAESCEVVTQANCEVFALYEQQCHAAGVTASSSSPLPSELCAGSVSTTSTTQTTTSKTHTITSRTFSTTLTPTSTPTQLPSVAPDVIVEFRFEQVDLSELDITARESLTSVIEAYVYNTTRVSHTPISLSAGSVVVTVKLWDEDSAKSLTSALTYSPLRVGVTTIAQEDVELVSSLPPHLQFQLLPQCLGETGWFADVEAIATRVGGYVVNETVSVTGFTNRCSFKEVLQNFADDDLNSVVLSVMVSPVSVTDLVSVFVDTNTGALDIVSLVLGNITFDLIATDAAGYSVMIVNFVLDIREPVPATATTFTLTSMSATSVTRPSSTSTSTTTKEITTTVSNVLGASESSSGDDNSLVYIAVGACVGVLLIIIVIALIFSRSSKKVKGLDAEQAVPRTGPIDKKDIGSRVQVEGRPCLGTLRFYGKHVVDGKIRCGVELDLPVGKNSGTIKGHTYFKCKPKHGVLTVPTKVTRAYTGQQPQQPDRLVFNNTYDESYDIDTDVVLNELDAYATATHGHGNGISGNPNVGAGFTASPAQVRTLHSTQPSLSEMEKANGYLDTKTLGVASPLSSPSVGSPLSFRFKDTALGGNNINTNNTNTDEGYLKVEQIETDVDATIETHSSSL